MLKPNLMFWLQIQMKKIKRLIVTDEILTMQIQRLKETEQQRQEIRDRKHWDYFDRQRKILNRMLKDKSNIALNRSMLANAYRVLVDAGPTGMAQMDFSRKLGIGKLESRAVHRCVLSSFYVR